MSMKDHSQSVEWRYVIPPANNVRVLIHPRLDGPFREDAVGGPGHYYTSVEELFSGKWRHSSGSATGGHCSFEEAYAVAERQWKPLRS